MSDKQDYQKVSSYIITHNAISQHYDHVAAALAEGYCVKDIFSTAANDHVAVTVFLQNKSSTTYAGNRS